MNKIALFALLTLPLLAFPAYANCDKPTNDFEGIYCLDKIYLAADQELNDVYKKLRGQLNAAGKEALKAGELDWIASRSNQCSHHQEGEFFVNLDCATKTTVDRLRFLQDRLRECTSSGCQNSKL